MVTRRHLLEWKQIVCCQNWQSLSKRRIGSYFNKSLVCPWRSWTSIQLTHITRQLCVCQTTAFVEHDITNYNTIPGLKISLPELREEYLFHMQFQQSVITNPFDLIRILVEQAWLFPTTFISSLRILMNAHSICRCKHLLNYKRVTEENTKISCHALS